LLRALAGREHACEEKGGVFALEKAVLTAVLHLLDGLERVLDY